MAVGRSLDLTGDIARLNAIGAKAPRLVEEMLGYEPGRLANGYSIALLTAPLRPNHLRFAGLTLRSGGRAGLPSSNPVEDKKREHVHDAMIKDYGDAPVKKMLEKLSEDPRNLTGPERIVKILPNDRHKGLNPAKEYPPGGGAGQWTMDVAHAFVVAAEVSAGAIASTAAGWSVPIGENAPYDGRAKLARYLADFGKA